MELYKIAARAIFTYVFFLILLRLAGKRTIAEGSTLDFIAALMLGDMVDDALWAEVPILQFLAALLALVICHAFALFLSYKSSFAHWLINGNPTLVLSHGQLIQPAMRKEKINEKELEAMLRLSGVTREQWSEVEEMTIEVNGLHAMVKTDSAKPAIRQNITTLDKSS